MIRSSIFMRRFCENTIQRCVKNAESTILLRRWWSLSWEELTICLSQNLDWVEDWLIQVRSSIASWNKVKKSTSKSIVCKSSIQRQVQEHSSMRRSNISMIPTSQDRQVSGRDMSEPTYFLVSGDLKSWWRVTRWLISSWDWRSNILGSIVVMNVWISSSPTHWKSPTIIWGHCFLHSWRENQKKLVKWRKNNRSWSSWGIHRIVWVVIINENGYKILLQIIKKISMKEK